jgi:hypothetical protein
MSVTTTDDGKVRTEVVERRTIEAVPASSRAWSRSCLPACWRQASGCLGTLTGAIRSYLSTDAKHDPAYSTSLSCAPKTGPGYPPLPYHTLLVAAADQLRFSARREAAPLSVYARPHPDHL